MKFIELVRLFQNRPFFETAGVRLAFNESPSQIEARLSRWMNEGKILQLRRKRYLLAQEYQRQEASSGYISNFLYRPSYISLRTALEIYGLIPESVKVQEAITTKKTAEWKTPIGTFKYYSIKKKRFWGYRTYPEGKNRIPKQQQFLLAEPEKTLLDLFYLMEGEWTAERIYEMRFQELDIIKKERLQLFTKRFDSPKVTRAVDCFLNMKATTEHTEKK